MGTVGLDVQGAFEIFHQYGDALRHDAKQLERLSKYCRRAADDALRESQGILGDTGGPSRGTREKTVLGRSVCRAPAGPG